MVPGRNSGRFSEHSTKPVIFCALLLLLVLPGAALGQETQAGQQTTDQQTDPLAPKNEGAKTEKQEQQMENHQQEPGAVEPPVLNLETGQAMEHGLSSIHWGRLSLFSITSSYFYNDLAVGSQKSIENTGVVRGYFVYSIKHGPSEIDLQFAPQALFSNQGNSYVGNQSLQLNTSHHVGSRWTLNLSDYFNYQPNTGYIPDPSIAPDFLTGGIRQNPFVIPNQEYYSNRLQPTLTYNMSVRNHFSFLAHYEFLHTSFSMPSGTMASPNPSGSDHLVGGGVQWDHNWSPNTGVGLRGSYDREFFSDGLASNYYSLILSYHERLSPTVYFSASIGPTLLTQSVPPVIQARKLTTYEATVSLTKSFRRSGLALNYSRDHYSAELLGGTITDRVGASYSQQLWARLSLGIGGGYLHQDFQTVGTPFNPYNGRTVWSQISYQVLREWSSYVTYSRYWDSGLQGQPGATQNFVVAGIRWSWETKNRTVPAGRRGGF